MPRPTSRQWIVAAVCLVITLAAAFAAAYTTRNDDVFSLTPPPPRNDVERGFFVESQRHDLHRTFFTAWAALLVTAPALCLFLFRHSSATAGGYWLAFWTAGLLAFAVHLYWAIVVMFDGDWSRISNTTRVSAAVLDTVFAVWWGLDVVVAWMVRVENRLIRIERTIVWLLAIVLFVAGSAIEGEIDLSRAIGYALAAAVGVSVLMWLAKRRRARPLGVAPAA